MPDGEGDLGTYPISDSHSTFRRVSACWNLWASIQVSLSAGLHLGHDLPSRVTKLKDSISSVSSPEKTVQTNLP